MTESADMVGKAARAILAAHDWTKNDGREGGWDTLSAEWQECFEDMARAAIETVREDSIGLNAQTIRLHCGELSAQEMRAIKAFIEWRFSPSLSPTKD